MGKYLTSKFYRTILLLATPLSLILNGCLRTYYPAIYESGTPPLIYQTSESTNKSQSYIGSTVTFAGGHYENEKVFLFKGNYSIISTQDYSNINWEAFGYAGNYKVSGVENFDGNKFLFGAGTDIRMSLNFKINKFKMGIGTNLGIGFEGGEYYKFRTTAASEGKIDNENTPIFFLVSFYPVLAYELSEGTTISSQINLGIHGTISPHLVLSNNSNAYWISFVPKSQSLDSDGIRVEFGLLIGLNNFINSTL